MKQVLVPLAIATAALLGSGACVATGWSVHVRELCVAAVIAVLGGEAALVPLWLVGRKDAAAVSQAALAGTVIQLLVSMVLSAVAASTGLAGQSTAFVWWTLAFYWSALAVVAGAMIVAIRSSARAGQEPGGR